MQFNVIFPCFHLMFWWCLWWCCRTWKFTFSSGQCPELPLQWGGCAAQHWVMLYVTWFNQSSHGGAVYCNVAPLAFSSVPPSVLLSRSSSSPELKYKISLNLLEFWETIITAFFARSVLSDRSLTINQDFSKFSTLGIRLWPVGW